MFHRRANDGTGDENKIVGPPSLIKYRLHALTQLDAHPIMLILWIDKAAVEEELCIGAWTVEDVDLVTLSERCLGITHAAVSLVAEVCA